MRKFFALVLLAMMTSNAAPVLADDGSTLRIVVVATDDVGAYVDQLKVGNQILADMDSGFIMRAHQATFAGKNTGSVVVSLEHAGNLSDFATAWEKNVANEELNSWLAGLSGLRTIVSDSIYTELVLD